MSQRPLGLTTIERALWPIPKWIRRGNQRLELLRRATTTAKHERRHNAKVKLRKDLENEAKLFGDIIIGKWDQLGYNHQIRDKGKRIVRTVQFERVMANDQVIYYKVLTRVRGFLGLMQQALPYQVRVGDLINEHTLQELSWTTQRVVDAVYEDPKKGVWIRLYRQESVGRLPVNVSFQDLLEHYPETDQAPILLGIGEHKKVVVRMLSKNPHILVGGSSGSGKSNILNVIIAGLMRITSPQELQFILIDLKMMEFKLYEFAPHLARPIVEDEQTALEVLNDLYKQVKDRAARMRNSDSRELSDWNKKHAEDGLSMPRIVCVIDEFAEMVFSENRDTAQNAIRLITRIGNLGRAVGIHLVVATQRPAVQVISNSIKINMSLVVAGRVQNRDQSKVILGNGSAAELPAVPGRMIYQEGASQYTIQTPYITEDDIRQSIRIARGRAGGIIRLEGSEPVIVPDRFALFLISHCKGSLALGTATKYLLYDFAVNGQMFEAFRADALKAGQMVIAGTKYVIRQRRGEEYLEVEATVEARAVVLPEVQLTTPEFEEVLQLLGGEEPINEE